jgi:hypothetical protein
MLLLATATGAAAWSLHLLLGYWVHASGCDNRFSGTEWALHLMTLVAVLATAGGMWAAWRAWQRRPADETGPVLSAGTRSAFLGLAGLGLSAVFLVAIVYGEVAVFLVPPCL